MESTVKIFSLLENTKFSASNDLVLLKTAVDLLYVDGKNVWSKGTKEREALLEMIGGSLILDRAAYTARGGLEQLVSFLQGAILLTLSLLNGIGRPPISVKRDQNTIKVTVLNKTNNISLTVGKFDDDMSRLIREFKNSVYGKVNKEDISGKELSIIKETFRETKVRLDNERSFVLKLEKDPTIIFKEENNGNFTPRFFLLISALPTAELNNLLINVGSYLPDELEEINEDMFKVKVRNYFTTSSQEMHELFKKVRLLLKLYFGKQKQIVSIIVREKTKELFGDILQNKNIKNLISENLKVARENQFEMRIKLLENLIKLL